MNIAINVWRYGSVVSGTLRWIEGHFTGWEYFKMWPFKKAVRAMFARVKFDLEVANALGYHSVEGDVTPYVIVRQLLFPVSE